MQKDKEGLNKKREDRIHIRKEEKSRNRWMDRYRKEIGTLIGRRELRMSGQVAELR